MPGWAWLPCPCGPSSVCFSITTGSRVITVSLSPTRIAGCLHTAKPLVVLSILLAELPAASAPSLPPQNDSLLSSGPHPVLAPRHLPVSQQLLSDLQHWFLVFSQPLVTSHCFSLCFVSQLKCHLCPLGYQFLSQGPPPPPKLQTHKPSSCALVEQGTLGFPALPHPNSRKLTASAHPPTPTSSWSSPRTCYHLHCRPSPRLPSSSQSRTVAAASECGTPHCRLASHRLSPTQ